MKRIVLTVIVAALLSCVMLSCDDKKSSDSSATAIAQYLEASAKKDADAREEKQKADEQAAKERELREAREEAEEAEEELRLAQEEAAIAKAEAAAAREEARRARREADVVASSRQTASVPGARLAHVIREGGYTNARSGPGSSYGILNKIKDGSPILYTGSLAAGWVRVYTLDGSYLGYMSSKKVIPEQ